MNKEFILDNLKIKLIYNEKLKTNNLLIFHIFNEDDHDNIYKMITKDGINDTIFVTIFGVNEEDLLNIKIDERIKYIDTFNLVYQRIKEEVNSFNNCYVIGYSLYGLLSTYLSYHVDFLSGVASVSPSFWIDGVINKLLSLDFKSNIKKIYLSIGDKENKRKRYFNVIDNINLYYEYLCNKGYNVKYELNSGNHFADVYIRIMKGVKYLISNN